LKKVAVKSLIACLRRRMSPLRMGGREATWRLNAVRLASIALEDPELRREAMVFMAHRGRRLDKTSLALSIRNALFEMARRREGAAGELVRIYLLTGRMPRELVEKAEAEVG